MLFWFILFNRQLLSFVMSLEAWWNVVGCIGTWCL